MTPHKNFHNLDLFHPLSSFTPSMPFPATRVATVPATLTRCKSTVATTSFSMVDAKIRVREYARNISRSSALNATPTTTASVFESKTYFYIYLSIHFPGGRHLLRIYINYLHLATTLNYQHHASKVHDWLQMHLWITLLLDSQGVKFSMK